MADNKKYLMQFYATIQGDKIVVKNMNRIKKEIKGTTDSTKSFGSGIKKALQLAGRSILIIPIWMAMRKMWMALIDSIKDGVTFLKEWEYQMAQVRIVGKATEAEMHLLSVSLLDLSASLGLSHKQLGEGAKLWAQQGRAIAEIIPLMDTTARMSIITGRTISQSVEDLTAVMKSYGVEANGTGKILDSLTNVMLNHAITADTLASALRGVAPVAAAMGVSFEQLQGIITATHVVTRSKGNKVGLAWRTIFARMATTAHKAIKEIAQVPVFLTKTGQVSEIETVNMRNLGRVLDEVAGRWNSLSSAQKINLAQAVAGKRRLTEFIAFMDNYNEAVKAQADALFGAGKAMKATGILSDTLKHRTEGMTQSWHELVNAIGGTELLKGVVTTLATELKFLAGAIDPATASYQAFVNSIKPGIDETNKQITVQENLIKAMHNLAERNEDIIRQQTPERVNELTRELGKTYIEAIRLANVPVPVGIQNSIELVDWLKTILPQTSKGLSDLYAVAEKKSLQVEIAGAVNELDQMFTLLSSGSGQWTMFRELWIEGLRDMELEYTQLADIIDHVAKRATAKEWLEFEGALQKYVNLVREFGETDKRTAEASAKVKELAIKKQEELKQGIETEAEARLELLNIELKGIRTGKSKLAIEQTKVEYLQREGTARGDNLQKELDSLKVSISKQEAQLEINIILEKEKGIIDRMKTLGAGSLQIEIQRLANMKARGIIGLELKQQEEKIAQVMKNQVVTSAQKLVNHELELLRIRGLSGSQLLVAKMAIEDAVFGRASETTELQRQLDMEKEITKEKQNQIEYSEESKKLYQVAVKYGEDLAKSFAEVLRGKKDLEDLSVLDQPELFEKLFPKFVERKKLGEFFGDEGKDIPIKERLDTKEIQEATNRIAQRQKTTEAFKFGVGSFDTAVNRFGIAIDKFVTLYSTLGRLSPTVPVETKPTTGIRNVPFDFGRGNQGVSIGAEGVSYREGMKDYTVYKGSPYTEQGGVIREMDVNIPVEINIDKGLTKEETFRAIKKNLEKIFADTNSKINRTISINWDKEQ